MSLRLHKDADDEQVATVSGLALRDVVAGYGDVHAVRHVSLEVEASEFATLVGPSGCGKTTLLRCVAGFEKIHGGEIHLGSTLVASQGLHVRPERRQINMVFQSYAVWPHMTVLQNVAYGLKGRYDKAEVRRRAMDMLELVHLSEFPDRYAGGLSGGQQQRVSLARALATQPKVLLLDEPLSSLDASLRMQMRREIVRIQQAAGVTTLFVTHDQTEALSMSQKVAVMRNGEIEQIGSPSEVYEHPTSAFVATFLGDANVIPATVVAVTDASFEVAVRCGTETRRFVVAGRDHPMPTARQEIGLVVRPESARVVVREASEGLENCLQGVLVSRQYLGGCIDVELKVAEVRVRVSTDQEVGDPGAPISVHVPPEKLAWVPAEQQGDEHAMAMTNGIATEPSAAALA